MDTQKFKEYLAREISTKKWAEEALEFIDGFQRLEKERDQAEGARDQAVADRAKALADIEARRAKDAKAADKERGDLAAMLARDQAQADRTLVATQGELKTLHAKIEQARVLVTRAEQERDTRQAALEQEIADLTAERDTLQAEEAAIRGRLTAALGR